MRKGLILLSILLLTGCSSKEQAPIIDNTEITDVEKFKKEYESHNNGIEVIIEKDDMIKYSTSKEILDILEKGTGIIYFGMPTCPWCRNILPILLDISKQYNIHINYLNPGELNSNQISDYIKIKEILSPYLEYNDEGVKTVYLPDVYFVKEGKVMGHHLGSAPSQDDPYTKLTENQTKELINIYTNYIEQIK